MMSEKAIGLRVLHICGEGDPRHISSANLKLPYLSRSFLNPEGFTVFQEIERGRWGQR